MLEPLGQSQVLAYLEKMAELHVIHLISFEKGKDLSDLDDFILISNRCIQAGISWHPRKYHKRPSGLATA
jgi:hypothetical protein